MNSILRTRILDRRTTDFNSSGEVKQWPSSPDLPATSAFTKSGKSGRNASRAREEFIELMTDLHSAVLDLVALRRDPRAGSGWLPNNIGAKSTGMSKSRQVNTKNIRDLPQTGRPDRLVRSYDDSGSNFEIGSAI